MADSPGSQTVAVCRLLADDWQAYRAIRLAMLQESPSAFGSTYAQAAGHHEQAWRQRLTDNAVFLALVDASPAGSVMYSERAATDPGDCALFGMWVDPGFRRTGVGRALVDAMIEQARCSGRRRIVLDFVDGNAAARGLYERLGFTPTGRTIPYPHDDRLVEVEMELRLDGVRGSSAAG